MNRLIILEDNLEFSRSLLNYIVERNKKIQLWSLAIDGEEMLEKIDLLKEDDIVLMDLGLPKINGIEVIDQLTKKKEHMPYIIVMSGNLGLWEKLRNYAPYIYAALEKPFALKRISEMLDEITYATDQKCYEKLVKEELRKFEMNITTIGYDYIVDAITLTLQDETLLKDMKNKLYKSISIKNNNINPTNIKWTIEKNIKSMVRYTSSKVTKEYFHVETREKITPKLFVSTIVNNLKQEIEKEVEIPKERVCFL